MRFHCFKIDELKRDKSPRNADVFYYVRRFFTFYRKNEEKIFDGHFEIRVVKPVLEFGWSIEVGNAGSSTPFDGHVKFFGSAIYWGLGAGRKLAQRLTTSEEEKYDSREISIRIWDKRLYLNLWVPDNRWKRGEFAAFRSSSINLSLADHIWGTKRYVRKVRDQAEFDIVMVEGSYPVVVKLERVIFGRDRSRKQVNTWNLDVDAPQGIPYRPDESGWKGDRVYGFSVAFVDPEDDWEIDAKNAITAWVLDKRVKSGFRKAEPITD